MASDACFLTTEHLISSPLSPHVMGSFSFPTGSLIGPGGCTNQSLGDLDVNKERLGTLSLFSWGTLGSSPLFPFKQMRFLTAPAHGL